MKSFSSKIYFFVSAAVAAVLIGALASLYIYLVADVGTAAASLESLVAKIHSEEENQRQARVLRGVLEDRAGEVARARSFFVVKSEPVAFIEFLEGLAHKTNNVLVIDPRAVPNDPNLHLLLGIDGTEKSALQYLSLLELAPYDIHIEDLNFQKLNTASAGSIAEQAKQKILSPMSHLEVLIKVNTRP